MYRTCSKCGETKSIDHFQADKSKKSGYKSQCKECIASNLRRKEYVKQYWSEHRDYYRQKHAEYRERNREKLRLKSREDYHNNPERHKEYYLKNKERILEYRREYRKTQKFKAAKKARKIRRKRITAVGDNDISLDVLYNKSNGICALCGKPCNYEDYVFRGEVFIAGNDYPSIDHIIPISKGGTHTWDNVQLAHRRCNSAKSYHI